MNRNEGLIGVKNNLWAEWAYRWIMY